MLIFYRRNDRIGCLMLPVLVALHAAIGSAQKTPSELRPNVRVEGHLQREYESYTLLLHSGQYARISVDAAGTELEGAISEGNKAVVSRFWVAAADTRHIPLVANADVQYLIRMSPAVSGDTDSYALEVEELRDATPRDYAIAEANEYLRRGEELARQQKEESYKQAIMAFQKSVEISRSEKDQQLLAQALNSLGEAFSNLSDYPAALNNFVEALD